MNKEQLLALGLDVATAEKVLSLSSAPDTASEVARLKESLAQRDMQIKSLKKFEGDNTELAKRIDALSEENRKTNERHQAEMLEEKKKYAVKAALLQRENKPHDADLTLKLLDLSSLGIDSQGNVTGAKELCDKFASERPYLFSVSAQPERTGINVHGANKAVEPKNDPKTSETESLGVRLAQAAAERASALNKILSEV